MSALVDTAAAHSNDEAGQINRRGQAVGTSQAGRHRGAADQGRRRGAVSANTRRRVSARNPLKLNRSVDMI